MMVLLAKIYQKQQNKNIFKKIKFKINKNIMDLSGMMTDLLKDQAIEAISKKTGLDLESSKSMASKALPMLLGALKNNSADDSKKESLEKAVAKNDGSILDNLDNIDLNDGSKILGHIFGDKKEEVEKQV
jgi:hypothetical protein